MLRVRTAAAATGRTVCRALVLHHGPRAPLRRLYVAAWPTSACAGRGHTLGSGTRGLRTPVPNGEVTLSLSRLDQLLEAEITALALRDPQPMSLQRILDSTKDASELASLLHEELPVRYAQRIKMLESLPAWHEKRSIAVVRKMYVLSFKELRLVDPRQTDVFLEQLKNIKKRHSHTNLLVGGFKTYAQLEEMGEREINDWLDRFFALRVSTNMLISQYIEIAKSGSSTMPAESDGSNPYKSAISPRCDPNKISRHAAEVISTLCKHWYGCAPEIQVTDAGAKPFPFVPRYLFYILSELLKNSVRATVEHSRGEQMAPVSILVSSDEDVLSMRISDEGGGIPVDRLDHVWSYLYTTADPIEFPMTREGVDAPSDLRKLEMGIYSSTHSLADGSEEQNVLMRSPLAGLGCGLPLSRLYAQYLGGELKLHTLPSFGTDIFVYLNSLGTCGEELPLS